MECITPSLAQASVAMIISNIIGMYIATLSPFFKPEMNKTISLFILSKRSVLTMNSWCTNGKIIMIFYEYGILLQYKLVNNQYLNYEQTGHILIYLFICSLHCSIQFSV